MSGSYGEGFMTPGSYGWSVMMLDSYRERLSWYISGVTYNDMQVQQFSSPSLVQVHMALCQVKSKSDLIKNRPSHSGLKKKTFESSLSPDMDLHTINSIQLICPSSNSMVAIWCEDGTKIQRNINLSCMSLWTYCFFTISARTPRSLCDSTIKALVRDKVQSFGEIRYLEFIQDRFTPLPLFLSWIQFSTFVILAILFQGKLNNS